MEYKEVMENIKKMNGSIPKPLKLLGELREESVVSHEKYKKIVLSMKNIPNKYKALILLAAGIAMDAPACILNNTMLAKKQGASVDEIMETFEIAKFAKAATTIGNSAAALEWLANNR